MKEEKGNEQQRSGGIRGKLAAVKAYAAAKNVQVSAKRYGVDAMGAMAQGLFASLLIGTILNTAGTQLGLELLTQMGGYASAVAGPAMAVSIGFALNAPALVLFSLITVGQAANSLGGAGGPLAVLIVAILACEAGKLVSKETKVDILVTPFVTIFVGTALAMWWAPAIGKAASGVGAVIMWATEQQPFVMGIVVSVVIGIALTLPISSAAICAALSLTGLAGGAAVAGCCAQMVGSGRRGGGRLLRPDGGLCGALLQREPLGRPCEPGAGHLHAADGQHPQKPPHLAAGHPHQRRHGAAGHLRVPAGDERAGRLFRHGHLRTGGPHRRLQRLGGGRVLRREGGRHRL